MWEERGVSPALRMTERRRRSEIGEEFGEPGKQEFDPLMGFKAAIHGLGPYAEATARGLAANPVLGAGPMDDVWENIADTVHGYSAGKGYQEVQDAAGGKLLPKDVKDVGEAFNAFLANLGLNSPNMITAMGAAALGAKIGGAAGSVVPGIGTAIGALVGGAAAGMFAMSLPETGNFIQTAVSLGIPKDKAAKMAVKYGAISGVVEYAQQMVMAKPIREAYKASKGDPKLRQALVRQALRDAAKNSAAKPVLSFLKDVFGEGFEEFLQEGSQVYMTNQLIKQMWKDDPEKYNPETLPLQTYDSLGRAATLGALVGAGGIAQSKALSAAYNKLTDQEGKAKRAEDRAREIYEGARARSPYDSVPGTPDDIQAYNDEFDEFVRADWEAKANRQAEFDDIQARLKKARQQADPLYVKAAEEMFMEDWDAALAEEKGIREAEARKRGISQAAYDAGLTAKEVDTIVAKIISGKAKLEPGEAELFQKHRTVIEKNVRASLGQNAGEADALIASFMRRNVEEVPDAAAEVEEEAKRLQEEQKERARAMGINEAQFAAGVTPEAVDALVKKAMKSGDIKLEEDEIALLDMAGEVFRNRLRAAMKDPDILNPGKRRKPPKPPRPPKPPNDDTDDDDGPGAPPPAPPAPPAGEGGGGAVEPGAAPAKGPDKGPEAPPPDTGSDENPKALAEKYGLRFETTEVGRHSFSDPDIKSSFEVGVGELDDATLLDNWDRMLEVWERTGSKEESGVAKVKREMLREFRADAAIPKVSTGSRFKAKMYRGEGKSQEEVYGKEAVAEGRAVPVAGPGKYFAFTEADASNYGEVSEQEVELNYPLVIDSDEKWFAALRAAGATSLDTTSREFALNPAGVEPATRKFQDWARNQGFDGIIFRTSWANDDTKKLRRVVGHSQAVVFGEKAKPVQGKGPGPWKGLDPAVAQFLVDQDVAYQEVFDDPNTGERSHTFIPQADENATSLNIPEAEIGNLEAVKKYFQ
jgi:hypothetical protein